MRRVCLACVALSVLAPACDGSAEPAKTPENAEPKPPPKPQLAAERGHLVREIPTGARLIVSAREWTWDDGRAAPTKAGVGKPPAPVAGDALDFSAHSNLINKLGVELDDEGPVTLETDAQVSGGAFAFAVEALSAAGARELRWRPAHREAGLELPLGLPRYEWSVEAQDPSDDPTELMLALRGREVIAGLRPFAYFAQDRIAADMAAIANSAGAFRTPVDELDKLPLAAWMKQLCGEAKDGTVHVGLSVDASSDLDALWQTAGVLEAPAGCKTELRLDHSLSERPEGPAPNIHAFDDARRIVDLTRPAEPRVRLHADRLRNAALSAADDSAIVAREPELMMTITDEEGRKHTGIRRRVWSVGRAINDCYREQKKSTPRWAPHAVATGMLRAPKRKAYVAIEGLESAPEFSACVKTQLEGVAVSEMDRLLGFRAEMDFYPFGGVVHD